MLKDDVLSALNTHSHISPAHHCEGHNILQRIKLGKHTTSSRVVVKVHG